MKFSTREDTDLTAEELFAAISDFPRLERVLQRKGAMVRRMEGDTDAWQIAFDWRAKPRLLELAVVSVVKPERIDLAGQGDQFDLAITMTAIALTPRKSRLVFDAEVKPRGMKARLLLQTAKLNRGIIERRFTKKVGDILRRLISEQAG